MAWFTDEALAQCGKTVLAYQEAMPISGKALACGVEWLSKANRLRLDTPLIPFDTEERLIAKVDEFGYGLDTPWPITAIEYEHGGTYDVAQDYTRALSTRRIALCVAVSDAMTPGYSDIEPTQDESQAWGSLLIWPITYFDEKREWEFGPGVAIIPREQAEKQMALASNNLLSMVHGLEAFARKTMSRSKVAPEGQFMKVYYQPMMPELCVKLGDEHSDKMIREGSLDALWVALGTNTAMGCQNVFIEKDSRALRLILDDKSRCSLDPFRGKRKLRWDGRGVWEQETRTPLALQGVL